MAMKQRQLPYSFSSLIFILAFLSACTFGKATPTPTAPPTAYSPTEPPTATLEPTSVPPEHRIGVRLVDGQGEFFDRETGEKFIPRGSNYIRLGPQQPLYGGATFTYHSTFNVGAYDAARAGQALQRMHAEGYNTVRVFLNGNCKNDCIGAEAGGLSTSYVANLVDFLNKAKAESIYVILTTDSEPGTPSYMQLFDSTWSPDFGGTNANLLRRGGILVGQQFWQDLIDALNAQRAPLDSILAYELRNELFFETNAGPLNLTTGTVNTANGKSYDMAVEADRQRMMDENLVLWIDDIREAILEHDPTALVSVGFFPPDAPNPWNSAPRYIRTSPAVWQSTMDFVDFHPYPGGYTLDKLVENLGMAGHEEKPVVMGEFGAARSTYSTAAQTAQALHDWQVDSCQYGFDGWLLWTWDSDEQTDFYNGLTDQGQIDQALAPVNRPDACQPGNFPFFEHNLALGKTVTVSRALGSNPASQAVDGTTDDWWGAGAPPPQWIQIDLGEAATVRLFRLITSQSPAGDTRHQLWAGPSLDKLSLLHTFEGYTTDQQILEYVPDVPVDNIRYVKVITIMSPSWVSWREIELLTP